MGDKTPKQALNPAINPMKRKNIEELHDAIRTEAYLLSEQAGHPPGMDKFFWQEAEALVLRASRPIPADRNGFSNNGSKKAPRNGVANRNPVKPGGKKPVSKKRAS